MVTELSTRIARNQQYEGTDNTNPWQSQHFAMHRSSVLTTVQCVWDRDETFAWMTTEEQLNIGSDSGDDVGGGTGAWAVYVDGVALDGTLVQEVVVLGATTANAMRHINRMVVVAAGAGGTNAGNIRATDAAGNTIGFIVAGEGISQTGALSVPTGYQWLLRSIHGSGVLQGGATYMQVSSRIRTALTDPWYEAVKFELASIATAFMFDPAPVMEPGMDIEFRCVSDVAGPRIGMFVSYIEIDVS